jgi:hypothetical protein
MDREEYKRRLQASEQRYRARRWRERWQRLKWIGLFLGLLLASFAIFAALVWIARLIWR